MNFISLFSGIEAASAAWTPLGWRPVAFAEIDPFCRAFLAAKYPDVPNLGDVTAITESQIKQLPPADLLVMGFPCQDLSIAGTSKGLNHADGTPTRSGLFFVGANLHRLSGARFLVIENVPRLLQIHNGQDFARVVEELVGSRFAVPPDGWQNAGVCRGPRGLLEWRIMDCKFHGLPQRRARLFLVLDTGDWSSRPPILFEPPRRPGNHPTRGQTPKDLAPTLESRARSGSVGTDFAANGGLIARTLRAKHNLSHRDDADTLVTHPLRGEGFDASEDGTGRGTPLIPDLAWAVQARDSKGPDSNTKTGHLIPVDQQLCGTLNANGKAAGNTSFSVGDLPGTLRGVGHGGGHSAVALPQQQPQYAAVRRLTPTECLRLQGFPDNYLDFSYKGRPPADSPKYRSIGNSIPVPVLRWIALSIQNALSTPQP